MATQGSIPQFFLGLTADQWLRLQFCTASVQPSTPKSFSPPTSSFELRASPDGGIFSGRRPSQKHVLQAHMRDSIDRFAGRFEAIKERAENGNVESAKVLAESAISDDRAFKQLKAFIEADPKNDSIKAIAIFFREQLVAENNRVFLKVVALINPAQEACSAFAFKILMEAIEIGGGHKDAEDVLIHRAPFYPEILYFLVARVTSADGSVPRKEEIIRSLLELDGLSFYAQSGRQFGDIALQDPVVKFFLEHRHPDFEPFRSKPAVRVPGVRWLHVVRNEEPNTQSPSPIESVYVKKASTDSPSVTKSDLIKAMKTRDKDQILSALNRLNDYLTSAGELGDFNRNDIKWSRKGPGARDFTSYELLEARMAEFVEEPWDKNDPGRPIAVGAYAASSTPQIELMLGDGKSKLTLYVIVGNPFKCNAKLVSPSAEVRSRWEEISKVTRL